MRIGGWDVGQLQDFSVLATLRSEKRMDALAWVVDGIYQLPLGMPYVAQIRALQHRIDALDHLALDAGGSGQGLPEHIRGQRLKSLVPVVITGGSGMGKIAKGRVTVGKTVLIRGMMQMVRRRELRVAEDAPGRDLLLNEMRAFQYMSDGGFRRMEARSGKHDDAVMATALAAFLAQRIT